MYTQESASDACSLMFRGVPGKTLPYPILEYSNIAAGFVFGKFFFHQLTVPDNWFIMKPGDSDGFNASLIRRRWRKCPSFDYRIECGRGQSDLNDCS